MKDKQALTRIIVVSAGILAATALHYLTSPSLILWHELFQRLYYLPIICAAIYFGWRGSCSLSQDPLSRSPTEFC
jgi:two-component system, NtrC family, sensor histidine kinase HydH